MTQITLNIPDDKMEFFLNYIKELDFVEIDEEYQEPTHEEIKASLKKAFEELKMVEEGKMKSRPIEELLNELRRDEL
jgi:hypothetical protein